ncbi:LysR family transcriptional regulator [Acetobacter orleanensis]|uniref:LysR family transcriptional regulator n=1 Tax=Acetobacter orleanensis TaxID=104099 RepID=A0A4Y3TLE8_9PROT|nr:LysR family transcriptional regulator [Acetobacter orleanensis]PCD79538.1 LysR family transcriptional regulator [Acetobacter orleanensis]GAN67577.1 transcriptional regulator LysR [Acetobacter orleanensis JCM 7639]GEB82563.1 LysR family transcriptional regulator [Acetobacter orleanensis]
MTALDVDGVRAFLMIADYRSFTRAAEALGITQAAVSVKLKRLEERLGQRLVERTPRQVRLSTQGEVFLPAAREFLAAHQRAIESLSGRRRQFRLGIASHVMGPEVPLLLARLKSFDPGLTLEVRLDASGPLLDAFDGGELDAIIIRSNDTRRSGEILGPEHFGWFAAPNFSCNPDDPLPLAGLSSCSAVRDTAMRLLDRASIRWTEVFIGETPAIAAALSAGLAISPFPVRLAPADVVDVSTVFGLPSLPSFTLVLHSSLSDQKTKESLRAITAAFREHRRMSDNPTRLTN